MIGAWSALVIALLVLSLLFNVYLAMQLRWLEHESQRTIRLSRTIDAMAAAKRSTRGEP